MLMIAALPLAAQERKPQDERVRASEPTVVTVRGKTTPVETNHGTKDRSLAGRVGGGFKTAAARTWNGVVRATGWLLDVKDDIPSANEGRDRQKQASR